MSQRVENNTPKQAAILLGSQRWTRRIPSCLVDLSSEGLPRVLVRLELALFAL